MLKLYRFQTILDIEKSRITRVCLWTKDPDLDPVFTGYPVGLNRPELTGSRSASLDKTICIQHFRINLWKSILNSYKRHINWKQTKTTLKINIYCFFLSIMLKSSLQGAGRESVWLKCFYKNTLGRVIWYFPSPSIRTHSLGAEGTSRKFPPRRNICFSLGFNNYIYCFKETKIVLFKNNSFSRKPR